MCGWWVGGVLGPFRASLQRTGVGKAQLSVGSWNELPGRRNEFPVTGERARAGSPSEFTA